MTKAIANKYAGLMREAKAYEMEFSNLLKQEFGKVTVPKWVVSVGDRIREVSKIAENVISNAESIQAQLKKGWEEIEQLPETTPVDIKVKLIKMEFITRMYGIVDAYHEHAEHLLDEVEWLVRMLKEGKE
jgi:hypothetical protein